MKSFKIKGLKKNTLFTTNIISKEQKWPAYSTGFERSKLIIKKTENPKPKLHGKELPFGKYTTDHLLEAKWSSANGWEAPTISGYHNFSLDPRSSVFHYGLAFFEGLKAFLDGNGKIRLFRPDLNMKRFNHSAERLSMPTIDEKDTLECIKEQIRLDRDWVPEGRGFSLYIRPTMISTTELIHVGPAAECLFFNILSPAGSYFGNNFKPITLYACTDYVRAWPGGTGEAKCGGNYAVAMMPQVQAKKKHNCDQVLWLFGENHNVTESGAMNFFLFWKNEQGEKELITAPLDGTILNGVTRDSVLQLARKWGDFKVSERYFNMKDIVRAVKENRVYEAFGAGTAAIIAPVASIKYLDQELPIKFNKETGYGDVAIRLRNELMDIMYGVVDHEWTVIVD